MSHSPDERPPFDESGIPDQDRNYDNENADFDVDESDSDDVSGDE